MKKSHNNNDDGEEKKMIDDKSLKPPRTLERTRTSKKRRGSILINTKLSRNESFCVKEGTAYSAKRHSLLAHQEEEIKNNDNKKRKKVRKQSSNFMFDNITQDDFIVKNTEILFEDFNEKYDYYYQKVYDAYKNIYGTKLDIKPYKSAVYYEYFCMEKIRPIAKSNYVSQFIFLIILIASICVGIQTYDLKPETEAIFNTIDGIILWIFIFEVVLNLMAEGTQIWKFFEDAWKCFDFIVVALALVPGIESQANVLRLLRLLRVLKLLRQFPELQIIIVSIINSFHSLGYIGILISLTFYIFAIAAVDFFGENDPHHFGNLHISLLSLWRSATGEDWTELMYTGMFGCDDPQAQGGYYGDSGIAGSNCTKSSNQTKYLLSIVYHISFTLLAGMVLLNLAVGVIIGSLFEAKGNVDNDYLSITIEKAENLMIADYDVGGLASSDPYVKATVGDYTKRCKTITNNLYPVWNEKLDKIPLDPHGSTILHLEVFDHDLIGDDDSLGYFEINFANLRWNKPVKFKLELDGSDKEESYLYIKLRRSTGPNHILTDNEKDKWDHVNDKFFIANSLLGEVKTLLHDRKKMIAEEKEKNKTAKKRWGLLNALRRM